MTTKVRGTLMLPLADQHDRDGVFLDPAVVQFDPEVDYPVTVEFNHAHPPVGRVRVSRAEDGSLVATGEIFDVSFLAEHNHDPRAFAVGVAVQTVGKDRVPILNQAELYEVALTRQHQDPSQPKIEVVP